MSRLSGPILVSKGDWVARRGAGAVEPVEPKVFIVVLNWNRAADTIECVRSLRGLAYSNVEVLVVDNASVDGSVTALGAAFPDLTVVRNAKNLGYSEGNNVGIRYALSRKADYVLLLNNDTVVDKDLLHELVRVATTFSNAGLVGPKIYDYREPTKVWFAGASIDWSSGDSPHLGLGEYDAGQFNRVTEVDRLTGCAMMVSREVFERVGLFDPRYFLYYEDVDLCVRAAKAGYKSYCVQTAKVWHKESSSTSANHGSDLHAYYHLRNRLLFLHTHFHVDEAEGRNHRQFFRKYLSRVILRPFDRAYRMHHAVRFWALTDFYLGRYGIKPRFHRRDVHA